MAYRFEFDRKSKVLLMRYEGRLTQVMAEESGAALQKYWPATSPSAVIVDFSSVTEFAVPTDFLRRVADQALIVDATSTPVALVNPAPVGFGLSRMFEIVGQPRRSRLHVVRSMDEAFTALGLQSPTFEPLT
jgi:hypothetical protein